MNEEIKKIKKLLFNKLDASEKLNKNSITVFSGEAKEIILLLQHLEEKINKTIEKKYEKQDN